MIGDAMQRRLKAAELAIVIPGHPVKAGDDVLVVTRDGRAMFRELTSRRDGGVVLDAAKPAYLRGGNR